MGVVSLWGHISGAPAFDCSIRTWFSESTDNILSRGNARRIDDRQTAKLIPVKAHAARLRHPRHRSQSKRSPMTRLVLATIAFAIGAAAIAQPSLGPSDGAPLLKTLPADTTTVADYYKQNVYDPGDEKIGHIADLVLDKSGAVPAAIISVGSFLGIRTKYVAVPFAALQVVPKEHKPHLVLDTNRRKLKDAPSFEFNRAARCWERVEE